MLVLVCLMLSVLPMIEKHDTGYETLLIMVSCFPVSKNSKQIFELSQIGGDLLQNVNTMHIIVFWSKCHFALLLLKLSLGDTARNWFYVKKCILRSLQTLILSLFPLFRKIDLIRLTPFFLKLM